MTDSVTQIIPPPAPAPTAPTDTRRRLRTLSTGLIAYGVIGIVLTVVLLGGELMLTSRMESVALRVTTQLGNVGDTLDKTATSLEAAGDASTGFAVTIEQAAPTLHQVDDTISTMAPTLRQLQVTLGGVSLLGATPFGAAGEKLGQVATQLEGLQGQVSLLADNLTTNKATLITLGSSLKDLATQLRSTRDTLGSGVVEDSLADLIGIVRLSIGLLAIWFAVPAVAALLFGVWLRGQLDAGPAAGRGA